MWEILMGVFLAAGLASIIITEIIITEIVRSVVDRRRVLRDGIGGTQDVAIWGCLVLAIFNLGALVCLILWLVTR